MFTYRRQEKIVFAAEVVEKISIYRHLPVWTQSKNTYKPDRIGMKQKATTEKQNSHKPARKDPVKTDYLIQVKILKKKTKDKATTSQWD